VNDPSVDLRAVKRTRRDAEVWSQQRAAQARLSPEERMRQNDAMTRVWHEAAKARQRAASA
jgi:hypothetical protein